MDRRTFLKLSTAALAGAAVSDGLVAKNPERKPDPERIQHLIDEAEQALETRRYTDSPWLIGALFYSQDYLNYVQRKRSLKPHEHIIASVAQSLDIEKRIQYLEHIHQEASRIFELDPSEHQRRSPIYKEPFSLGHSEDHSHQNALGIFPTDNPTATVFAPRDMLLLLSEGGEDGEGSWNPRDPLSTISPLGGNVIIGYSPSDQLFWRFAHLSQLSLPEDTPILAGSILGTTGSTGLNAAKPGHGDHVHIEVHQAISPQDPHMQALRRPQIKRLLAID